MLLAVAQRVVHCRVDKRPWAYIVAQVFLALGHLSVSFGLAVVQVIVIGVVCEKARLLLHVVAV